MADILNTLGLAAALLNAPNLTSPSDSFSIAQIIDPKAIMMSLEEDAITKEEEEEEEKNPWSGSLGLGVNGSDGSTTTFNLRISGAVKRETPEETFTSDVVYLLQYDDGNIKENNGVFNINQVWNLDPTGPWNIWAQGTWQYDSTEGYRTRITGYSGAGYKAIKKEDLTVNLKGGFGAKWDYRGDTAVVPQVFIETTVDWKIRDGLSLAGNASMANDVTALNSYLFRTRIEFKADIQSVKGLAMTLGIRNEYDSTPSADSSYNQLWYWLGLNYSF